MSRLRTPPTGRATDPVTGIGFGFTDIGPTGMQRFISAQTYAMRSSFGTRLGFAVVPRQRRPRRGGDPGPHRGCDPRLAVRSDRRLHRARANRVTSTSPAPRSPRPGGPWRTRRRGRRRGAARRTSVEVRFDEVGARGATWFSAWRPLTGPPVGCRRTDVRDRHDRDHDGAGRVCLGPTGHVFQRRMPAGATSLRRPAAARPTHWACSRASSTRRRLSCAFRRRAAGRRRRYTGDVTVSWDVSDPQTPISAQSGCETAMVTTDTAGTTFTCVATSEGGTSTESVTVSETQRHRASPACRRRRSSGPPTAS